MILFLKIKNQSKYIALFTLIIALFTSCDNKNEGKENIPAEPIQHEMIRNIQIKNEKTPQEIEIIFPEDSIQFFKTDTLEMDTTKTATQPEIEGSDKKPTFKSFYKYLKLHKKSPVALAGKEDLLRG